MSDRIYIYVLPTQTGLPPRAMLMDSDPEVDNVAVDGQLVLEGTLAVWVADMGVWTSEGTPLPQPLSDAITEHARNLGVSW